MLRYIKKNVYLCTLFANAGFMNQEVNHHAMRRGLTLGAFFAINYILSTFQAVAFITWGVEILIIYYVYKSVVDCRENVLEGVISYGGAWWYVVKLFLYSSMVAGVCRYVYLRFIRTEYLGEMLTAMEEVFRQMKLGGAVLEQSMASAQQLLTPENMAIYGIVADVLLGVVLGLIMAAIVNRK